LIVDLDENAFSEYVVYSLKQEQGKIRGLCFAKSSAIECSIQFDDLEIAGIVAVNPEVVEKGDVEDYEREFLVKLCNKKEIESVCVPDGFKDVESFSDFFRVCAKHKAFVAVEGLEEGQFDVLEFCIENDAGRLICREIYCDGEVQDQWYEFNSACKIARAEVFDIYSNNLQVYVHGKAATKLKLIKN